MLEYLVLGYLVLGYLVRESFYAWESGAWFYGVCKHLVNLSPLMDLEDL